VTNSVPTAVSDDQIHDEQFREVADAVPVGLWRINASFEQDWVNKHWLDFTGGRLDEEVGFAWVEKVHPDDRTRVLEEFDRAFEAREATVVEFRLRGKDGVYRWFLDSGAPYYRDGEFAGFVGSCFDINERKQAEIHLQAREVELIDRSGTEVASILGCALTRGVGQPLFDIGTCADDLVRLIAGRSDLPSDFAQVAASIGFAAKRARDALRYCEDMGASGTVEQKYENLSATVRLVEPLIQMNPAAAGATIKWDLAPELAAKISVLQIQQVLLNLAVNGLQAMRGMPEPMLAISAAKWGHTAVISVADQGPGIAEVRREQLFEQSSSEGADSGGLGLLICRLMVTAHGGRIWSERNPGGGSIFKFTIPVSATHEHQ
jgi:PAS domain S-box-containing protein